MKGNGRLARALRSGLDRPPLVVGAIVLASAGVAAAYSLKINRFEPDEVGYTHLAIGIAHSLTPFTLSYGGAQRLNQLYPLLIAPLWGLFGNVTAFHLTHAWNALLLTSAAIPSYLLAREVVPARWAAYLAAALVAVAPWLTLSTGELTEVAAYPACAWALLAMQRALADPGWRRDLLALLAIGVATYGRLQLIVLAPALVVAAIVHEFGYALTVRGEVRRALRQASGRMLHEHRLLSAAAAVGVLAGLPLLLTGRLASAAGFYGDTLNGATINGATFDLARSYLTFIALGLGALPAALTFGFAFQSLVAPLSRRAHAYASIAIVVVVALTLQVAEVSVRFNGGTLQERYLFYIAPLLAVGMFAALLSTVRPWRAVALGAGLLAVLVGTTHYDTGRTSFWYQVSPGGASFNDWLSPLLGTAHGSGAIEGASTLAPTALAILASGALVAMLVRRFRPSVVLAGVAVVVIAFCSVETLNAFQTVLDGNSSGAGFGSGSLRDVSWVDGHVPAGARVAQLDQNVGGLAEARVLWQDDPFWNRTVIGAYAVNGYGDAYLPTLGLRLDFSSGALVPSRRGSGRAAGLGHPPPFLVLPTRGFPIVPVGTALARSPNDTLELLRVAPPLRASWAVSGVSDDGWLYSAQPVVLRLYLLRDAPGRCATVALTFSLSSVLSSAWKLRLTGSAAGPPALLEPGRQRSVQARVCGARNGIPQLEIVSAPQDPNDHPELTPQLSRVAVVKG